MLCKILHIAYSKSIPVALFIARSEPDSSVKKGRQLPSKTLRANGG